MSCYIIGNNKVENGHSSKHRPSSDSIDEPSSPKKIKKLNQEGQSSDENKHKSSLQDKNQTSTDSVAEPVKSEHAPSVVEKPLVTCASSTSTTPKRGRHSNN